MFTRAGRWATLGAMRRYAFDHRRDLRVVVDRGGQRLLAELDEQAAWDERPPRPPGAVGGYGPESILVLESGNQWRAPLHASVAAAGLKASFTPLFALAAKAKRFDERLYASVERLSHEGAAEHGGLFALLEAIGAQLGGGSAARGLFEAAAHLAADPPPLRGTASAPARKWLAKFLTDPKRSKPIGFYAESEALARVFRHDRLLQSSLEPHDAAAVRAVLDREPGLRAAYRRHLSLTAQLSGPPALPSVEAADAEECAVLPPSDSAEARLIKQLFGAASVPAGFGLGAELVLRLRDGRLRSEPGADEGWYAHQFHAIAALLTPETEGLCVGPRYRRELEETFQALFAMNRETHLKQLELTAAGGVPFIVAPRISVEPLPEFYARSARGYRYVRERLAAFFGEHVLRCAELEGAGVDLWAGLVAIEALMLGAETTSREELGRPAESSFARELARNAFRAWQRDSPSDLDLAHDLRVAVPLWFDAERRTVRLSATLGVETRTLRFEYLERPAVSAWGPDGRPAAARPRFGDSSESILSPITIECDVREPPTRAEFRQICDRHDEPQAVRRALEAR